MSFRYDPGHPCHRPELATPEGWARVEEGILEEGDLVWSYTVERFRTADERRRYYADSTNPGSLPGERIPRTYYVIRKNPAPHPIEKNAVPRPIEESPAHYGAW